jgi:hypothetical protein
MDSMSATTPPEPAQDDTVLCPRCSSPFECGAKTGGCWCTGVVLDDQIRADLASFYKGCLTLRLGIPQEEPQTLRLKASSH